MKRRGVVLVFDRSVTMEEAKKIVADLAARQVIECDGLPIGSPPKVHEFESDHGGPVWYIP